MERVENDQKSQFFYAFAANPGFIEIHIVIDLTHRLAEHAGRSTIKYIFMLLNHGGTSVREGSRNRDNAG